MYKSMTLGSDTLKQNWQKIRKKTLGNAVEEIMKNVEIWEISQKVEQKCKKLDNEDRGENIKTWHSISNRISRKRIDGERMWARI